MSRFQLSLNVADVETAVDFHTKLFGVSPAKHRKGYANFVVEDPPLKLVVIEDEGEPGSINHVGIELADSSAVASETKRVSSVGLPIEVDDPHTCCFATQEKAWTQDADGIPWELYTVVEDTSHFGASPRGGTPIDMILPPVTLADVTRALEDNITVVIDAQGAGGYETAHIGGAIDFALDDVSTQAATAISAKDTPVIVYCSDHDCLGSEFVGTQLVEAGYTDVRRFAGGIDEWSRSALDVYSGDGR